MINSTVKLGLFSALLCASLASGSASAASECKGLENAACGANAACGWIEGYERKDGRKVKSFCRAKSKGAKKGAKKAKGSASIQLQATMLDQFGA